MRSSIACSRCRRSKIKCVNAGIDTTCRACESSGRECVYPTPAAGSAAAANAAANGLSATNGTSAGHGHSNGTAKRDITAALGGVDGEHERNGESDGPKRQRAKKSSNSNSAASGKDTASRQNGLMSALDSPILTQKLWNELFEHFQRHFAATLPFLQRTDFLTQTRQHSNASGGLGPDGGRDNSRGPSSRTDVSLILLGVLTLTARFSPQLIQYHSPSSSASPSNPLAASEFYSNVLRARLAGADGGDLASADIPRIQAYLMLGLHEWGMCRGKTAWIYVGMAIRMSQTLGLSIDPDFDHIASSRRPSLHSPALEQHHNKDTKDHSSEDVMEQEAKRRTFWSCFMLDRLLSGGRHRPRTIRVRDISIQLPSDSAFDFGERVRTSRLSSSSSARYNRRSQSHETRGVQIPSLRQSIGYPEDAKLRNGSVTDSKPWPIPSHRSDGADEKIDRWEVGTDECFLGRLIRIIKIWGGIAKWSCSSGRKLDEFPPWHPESRFTHFRDQLVEFQAELSIRLQYSTRNTTTHITQRGNISSYSLVHIIYFLSVIVLHRTYLPFLPLRITDPQGPIDEPSFPAERCPAPDGYWRHSARELFKASRQMLELTSACHDSEVLVEMPLVGFAIYNAAFMGVYALHFEHMDQEGSLCSKPYSNDFALGANNSGQSDVRKAVEILGDMRPRLKLASGWFRTLHRLHVYFSRAKRTHKRSPKPFDSMPSAENDGRANGRSNGVLPRDTRFNKLYDEFKSLDRLLMDLGSTEDQATELNISDDIVGMLAGYITDRSASDATINTVKSEGDTFESHTSDNATRQEAWVPVNINSPGHSHSVIPPPTPPATKEILETGLPRTPFGNDGRSILPAPSSSQSTYTLPPFPPTYRDMSIAPTVSPTNSVSAQLPPPSQFAPVSGRLQTLQPWPTSRQPPTSYSQSLPYLNAAAQQNFPTLPPLPPTHSPASINSNGNSILNHTSSPHLTPPPRPDGNVRPLSQPLFPHHATLTKPASASLPYPSLEANGSGILSTSNLGGDDMLAFIEGESYEKWPLIMNSYARVSSGWLNAVWTEHSQY